MVEEGSKTQEVPWVSLPPPSGCFPSWYWSIVFDMLIVAMADGEENCFQDGAEYDSYGNRIRHKKVRLNYDTGYNNQVSGHQVQVIRKIDLKNCKSFPGASVPWSIFTRSTFQVLSAAESSKEASPVWIQQICRIFLNCHFTTTTRGMNRLVNF